MVAFTYCTKEIICRYISYRLWHQFTASDNAQNHSCTWTQPNLTPKNFLIVSKFNLEFKLKIKKKYYIWATAPHHLHTKPTGAAQPLETHAMKLTVLMLMPGVICSADHRQFLHTSVNFFNLYRHHFRQWPFFLMKKNHKNDAQGQMFMILLKSDNNILERQAPIRNNYV